MTGSVQSSSTLSSDDFGETTFIQRSYYWRQPKQHQSVGQFSAWADMVRAPGDPARWRDSLDLRHSPMQIQEPFELVCDDHRIKEYIN